MSKRQNIHTWNSQGAACKECREGTRSTPFNITYNFLYSPVPPAPWVSSPLMTRKPNQVAFLGLLKRVMCCVLSLSFVHLSICTWLCSLLLASLSHDTASPGRMGESFPCSVTPCTYCVTALCVVIWLCIFLSPKKTDLSGAQSLFFSAITRTRHVVDD